MNITAVILTLLRTSGPLSRTEIEARVVGYSPASVALALWQMKRDGKVVHVRRASRHRSSLYGPKEC